MVLDSNVDPRKVWYQANLDQDVAFDRVVNIWFGRIAFLPAGYAQFLWPGLAEVFAAWVHHGDAQASRTPRQRRRAR
jgi:hypothetical protein